MSNYRINARLSFEYFSLQSSQFLNVNIYFCSVILCKLLSSSGGNTDTGVKMGATGSDLFFLAHYVIEAKEILIEIYIVAV